MEIVHLEGHSAWRLANAAMTLLVIPALGGKIASLVSNKSGEEWLWRNPALNYQKARYGDNYVRLHDTGGIDECVPTVNRCKLPTHAGIWSGAELPDHGELFSQPWQIIAATVDETGAAVLHLEVQGDALPYRLQRILRLPTGDAPLEITYSVENKSTHCMPFYWCLHPILKIYPGMRLCLPQGQVMRTAWASDGAPTVSQESFRWPKTDSGFDLSTVPSFDLEPFAAKLFTEQALYQSRAGRSHVGVENPSTRERLDFELNADTIPYVALWLNYGAWSGVNTAPYFNLGLEPTNANSDSLAEQMSSGRQAVEIEALSSKTWTLRIGLLACK